jgi:TetR/AcrR family transcriptional regulator, transcriptional repressor for nem operon
MSCGIRVTNCTFADKIGIVTYVRQVPIVSIDFSLSSYILVGMLSSKQSRKAAVGERRNPERTRERLLQAAFQEIYKTGFRGTDVDTILRTAGVTKGAMYHYFENKEALGYAVVDEILASIGQEKWSWPLKNAVNPIDTLIGIIRSTSLKPSDVRCGCALNNLSQEMSPLDEGFRKRTAKLFGEWQRAIASALRIGKKRGMVHSGVNPEEMASFLIATYEGYLSLAKSHQDVSVLRGGEEAMISFLESLRAPRGRTRVEAF